MTCTVDDNSSSNDSFIQCANGEGVSSFNGMSSGHIKHDYLKLKCTQYPAIHTDTVYETAPFQTRNI